MSFADVQAKTTITGFTVDQKNQILADLKTAYTGSKIAQDMIDTWLSDKTHTIDISNVKGVYQGYFNKGKVEIDPNFITDFSYISDHGTATLHSELGALVHELGHALTGKTDNYNVAKDFYMGDNVTFINTIWTQLGIPLEESYIAQSWAIGSKAAVFPDYDFHKTGYAYTNNTAITGAITSNAAVTTTGKTNDLLIGGPGANTLSSGAGDDWIYGAGGNDTFNGGEGKDIIGYFGDNPADYDVRESKDGKSWTVRHVRGTADEGNDTAQNIEQIKFDKQIFDLKKDGLTFQTDFAFVIDTTGSMGTTIGDVKSQATNIINTLFADNKVDARIGIVGFKDTTDGEPSSVILKFTDQDKFADRQTAALNAINSIGVGGGGDTPETPFDGMLKALDGSMGDWRGSAGTRTIVLFTDAPAKDGALFGQVLNLFNSIGKNLDMSLDSSTSFADGSIDGYSLSITDNNLALPGDGDPLPTFTPSGDPVTPDTSVTKVQLYTVFVGPTGIDTTDLQSISGATGGGYFTATPGKDLLDTLFDIIKGEHINGTPDPDTLTGGEFNDTIKGFESADSLDGGPGADAMFGGPGDDIYFVDNIADNVVEVTGEGSDTVKFSLSSYTLGANVENGIALLDTGVTLTGNELANHLTGGKGDDTLIGDPSSSISAGSGSYVRGAGTGNKNVATAVDISKLFSLGADSDIANATTVPHVSISGKGDGTAQFYAIKVGHAGDQITLDVDGTNGYDSLVTLFDAKGTFITSDDDSLTTDGAGGSTSGLDSFLQFTFTAAGTYYFSMDRLSGTGLTASDNYELQVSLTGETLTPAGAADVLDGGAGKDKLTGGAGGDTFVFKPGNGADEAVDFSQAEGDKIDLSGFTAIKSFADLLSHISDVAKEAGLDETSAATLGAQAKIDLGGGDVLTVDNITKAGFASGDFLFVGGLASIAALDARVDEGNAGSTSYTFTINLSQAASGAQSVAYAVTGTGTHAASASDFVGGVLPSGTVNFANGESSKVLTINVNGDTTLEDSEGFLVTLSSPSAGIGLGATTTAEGTITNDEVGKAPTGYNDLYITKAATVLAAPIVGGVLANDVDPNGLSLTASLGATTSHGSLTLNSDGSFSYTPNAGFIGTDSFTYTASDGFFTSSTTTAHIVVGDINALQDPEQQIGQLYVGYYNRAPDVGGLNFWISNFTTAPPPANPFYQNLPQAADSFADPGQAETIALYPFLAHPELANYDDVVGFVQDAYHNLFNRETDPGGEAFWSSAIAKSLGIPVPTFNDPVLDGTAALGASRALLAFIFGALDTDAQTVANKVTAGLYYKHYLEDTGVGATSESAHAAFSVVTFDPASVLASEALTNAFVQSVLHEASAPLSAQGIVSEAQQPHSGGW